jgi:molecular chaperone GrpE
MEKTETKEALENKRNDGGPDAADSKGIKDGNVDAIGAEGEESEALSKLKEELEATKDKYLRLYSEFDNFRKRTFKEKNELIQSANEQLIRTLLPVADDFERAENSFADRNDPEREGFLLIHLKFRKVFELHGVKVMEVKQGSAFDPEFHEAISQIPAPESELKGKVIEVIEKGYLLNDKVIRYAKVVVGN